MIILLDGNCRRRGCGGGGFFQKNGLNCCKHTTTTKKSDYYTIEWADIIRKEKSGRKTTNKMMMIKFSFF